MYVALGRMFPICIATRVIREGDQLSPCQLIAQYELFSMAEVPGFNQRSYAINKKGLLLLLLLFKTVCFDYHTSE